MGRLFVWLALFLGLSTFGLPSVAITTVATNSECERGTVAGFAYDICSDQKSIYDGALVPIQSGTGCRAIGIVSLIADFAQSLAAEGTTPLYRAVMDSELADIQAGNGLRTLPGQVEGKYFSTTAEGASSYAQQAFGKFGDTSPYTLIKVDVPNSLIPQQISVDGGIPTVVLPQSVSARINAPGSQLCTHSKITMKPEAIIEIRFKTTTEGGRKDAVYGQQYACVFGVDGEHFDCRLLLNGRRLELGQTCEVPVVFLKPNLVVPKLSVGKSIMLWEGKEIATGKVMRLGDDANV